MTLHSLFCEERWYPDHQALWEAIQRLDLMIFSNLSNSKHWTVNLGLVAVLSGGRFQKCMWQSPPGRDSNIQDPWDAGNAALGLVGSMDWAPAWITGMCCSQPGVGTQMKFLQRDECLTFAQASEDTGVLIRQLHFSFFTTQSLKKNTKKTKSWAQVSFRFHEAIFSFYSSIPTVPLAVPA